MLTDCMLIDTKNPAGENNLPAAVGTEDASTLSGSPVASGPFYAYRFVLPIWSQQNGHHKLFVALLCTYPHYGAVFTRIYDPNVGWQPSSTQYNGWGMLVPTPD